MPIEGTSNPTYKIGVEDTKAKAIYSNKTNQMDRDAFLKLLVAQLRYQDPMNPMQDRDFIAQMTQISALEQTQATAKTQRLAQAADLIGKQIEYLSLAKLKLITADVEEVNVEDSEPLLVVSSKDTQGKEITETVSFEDLRKILPPKSTSTTGGSGQ